MATDLIQLARECPNISVTVNAGDLMSAIERCVSLSLRAAETARKEPDRLVSRDEAAKMLGVTETTLYRWASRGYLTPVKIGVSVRYWMHDLISLTKREDLKGKRQ